MFLRLNIYSEQANSPLLQVFPMASLRQFNSLFTSRKTINLSQMKLSYVTPYQLGNIIKC